MKRKAGINLSVVSPYLRLPLRSLEQALVERAEKKAKALSLGQDNCGQDTVSPGDLTKPDSAPENGA